MNVNDMNNEIFIQNRIGALNVKRERQRRALEVTDTEMAYWNEKLSNVKQTQLELLQKPKK